jgi:hypothetical protein
MSSLPFSAAGRLLLRFNVEAEAEAGDGNGNGKGVMTSWQVLGIEWYLQ